MTPAERTAKIAELRAEADRLEREARRNWPDSVEPGMLFLHTSGGIYIYPDSDASGLTCLVQGPQANDRPGWTFSKRVFNDVPEKFTYLGHARDLLTIKTPDAHEPTGAELVGKVCEFSDGAGWSAPCECTAGPKYRAANGLMWQKARLYREDRP